MDGSLRDLLNKHKSFWWKIAIKIMFKIIKSYEFMHKAKMVHRDLKPDNILFNRLKNGDYEFKIADFGLAKELKSSKNTYGAGSRGYWAPEQSDSGDGKYDSKVDVYPIGVMMFELLIGKDPLSA